MENKVTSPVPAAAPVALPLSVIEARKEVVISERGSYGAKKKYAVELNNTMTYAWYAKDAEKSPLIESERQNLMQDLKSINHSNPHKIWADIKGYALEDAQDRGLFGEVKPVADAKPAEGESTGNANINAPRPLQLRLVEELTSLYKVCEKDKAFLSTGQKTASMHISKALEALGVNLGMIKVGK
jgi:hypothetical protein